MALQDDIAALLQAETYVLVCAAHPHDPHALTPLIVAYDAASAIAAAERQGWQKTAAGWTCATCNLHHQEQPDGSRDDAPPAGDAGYPTE